MSIAVNTATLQKALQDVSVVLKSANKFMGAPVIQLQIEDNSLRLAARNNSTTFVGDIHFEGAQQLKVTAALAPAPFMPYVLQLTAEKTVLEFSDTALTITTASDEAVFSLMPAEFFWDSVARSFNNLVTVRVDALQEVYDQVSYATLKYSDQSTAPARMSIHLRITSGQLIATALTGIQLAQISRPVVASSEFSDSIFAVDLKTVVILAKSTKQEFIDLHFSSGNSVGFGGLIQPDYEIAVLVQLLNSPFRNVSSVLEAEADTQVVQMPRAVLVSALSKAQLVSANAENAVVSIRFGADSSIQAGSNISSVKVALPPSDQSVTATANLGFLLSALKVAGTGPTVALKFWPADKPDKISVFIRDIQDGTQVHLLSLIKR